MTFYKQIALYTTIDMMRRRRLITHPSHAPSETRIAAKPKPKPPGIIDLTKHDEAYWNYIKRSKNRKL